MILSDALIYPYRSFKYRIVTTSPIRSHIEYLIRTYYILVLMLLATTADFNAI